MVHHILVYECNDDFPRELLTLLLIVDAIASNMGTLFLRQPLVNTLIASENFCNKNCIEIILFKDY